MIVMQVQYEYKFVGLDVCTRDKRARAYFEQYLGDDCVNHNIIYDVKDIAKVEAAMNGPLPPGMDTPYKVVGAVVFGLALQGGAFPGTPMGMVADPVPTPTPEPQPVVDVPAPPPSPVEVPSP